MEKLTNTVKEAAKILSLSMLTMYALTEKQGFPCIRVGKKKLIPKDQLIDWMGKNSGERG